MDAASPGQPTSEETKSKVPCQLDVPYGSSEGQRADIFGGDSLPKGAPILVYIHGGYWQALNRQISSYCVQPLYNAGVRVVVLGYDLAPAVKLGDIVEEINSSGKFILELAEKYSSKEIILVGHCAGATLILTLLTSKWFRSLPVEKQKLFTSVVLISGLYDLAPLVYTKHNAALQLTQEEISSHSPLHHLDLLPTVSMESLHFLTVLAEHDSPEFFKQTETLLKALKEKGSKKNELLVVNGVDHFDEVEKLEDENYSLTRRITKLFKSNI
ncbi:Kynurenine formamidase [Gryllus bimaculatus]|nr:Kynurenine formamidase [Gryllus bimaculatus]